MTGVARKVLSTVGFFAIFTLTMRAFHLKEYLRHTNSRRFCPLLLLGGNFNRFIKTDILNQYQILLLRCLNLPDEESLKDAIQGHKVAIDVTK